MTPAFQESLHSKDVCFVTGTNFWIVHIGHGKRCVSGVDIFLFLCSAVPHIHEPYDIEQQDTNFERSRDSFRIFSRKVFSVINFPSVPYNWIFADFGFFIVRRINLQQR
jgi:hypothetical protein